MLDEILRLLMAQKRNQMQPQQMQQPPDSAVTGIGPMPQMHAQFGDQVKDYLGAGSALMGGAGMLPAMGRGVARAATGPLSMQAGNASMPGMLGGMAAGGAGMYGLSELNDAMSQQPADMGMLQKLMELLRRKKMQQQQSAAPMNTMGV